MELTQVLLFFSACIIGAIFLYWIIPLGKKKLFEYKHNARKKRLIADLINKSISQRSKFRIEILDGTLEGNSCEGVCSLSRNNQISIELVETFAAQQLKNSSCRIFFQIMQGKKIAFFHFNATCLDTSRRKDFTTAIFNIPLQIESGQKRKSLRCVPPRDSILGVGVWKLGKDQPLPTKKGDIAQPLFAYRPRHNNIMGLQNISAGGIRLLFQKENEDSELIKKFKMGEHILCLLMISTPFLEKKNLALWVSCRVVSKVYQKKEKAWQLGLSFAAWASMDEGKKEIFWFPNDENSCVPALAPVILRWNIEQNKK